MKILFIALLFPVLLYGQEYEKVNIYIIPFGREHFVEPNITADFLRVHPESEITISNERLIKNLLDCVRKVDKKIARKASRCDFNRCRIVVDFIDHNEIAYTIAISDGFEFITDDGYSIYNKEVVVNKEDRSLLCYLKSNFPTLIECLPLIDCGNVTKH